MCGTPVGAAGAKRGKQAAAAVAAPAGNGIGRNLPWIVAGGAVVALAAILLFRPSQPSLPVAAAPPVAAPAAGGAAGDPSAIDLSSMTPREAADRLFNRVMTAVSGGDTAQARQFAPMAISAYEMVEGLDLDGQYHLAVIHLVNGQPDEALAIAESILAEAPAHLFGHFTAAEAEQMRGNTEAARQHFRQFLDNYADEMASGRVEYNDHAPVLPEMREQANQAVGDS